MSRQREFFTERILEAVSDEFSAHWERADERREALLRCLEKLDERRRSVVIMYYSSARQTGDSVATRLSMTPGALRQSLFRIRRLLFDCVSRTMRVESWQ
jgi:DNA-directed RNA polymerase specialized sigma24 family protein